MKKEIVSGLALVTLSALPTQALGFGTGNIYDRYWAGEKISLPNVNGNPQNTKLLPDKPILQPIQVPESQIPPAYRTRVIYRAVPAYGISYPIDKPVQPQPIYVTKYGIPYPREIVKPDRINVPTLQ